MTEPLCEQCGKNQKARRGWNRDGSPALRRVCNTCRDTAKGKPGRGRRVYRTHKGLICEECGFVPVHPCQLDVDHLDGDHTNDDPSNLQTLCANCHRLKTFALGEFIKAFEG